MNEQQVSLLIAAMSEQTKAMQEQTVALNRLVDSNEALVALLYQSLAEDIETTTLDFPVPTYLSGKLRG
ncbi:hypothetical protein QMS56_09580 [Cronobacter malonaticus]|uniref:Uncharacterized protein n=1 Tax=Cronobacter dublinensis 1210 TaxID=1208656 RepID=A0ABP1WCU1_9ENTR|nr:MULTISPECIES: hypothetical protein [Cronobacter]CCJ83290.1 hypothetical protein BN134_4064 [Cronobacter dublinensis 1210]ALB67155.1 hypothetical protein AFK67_11970 [Cronobacter dublinensis subsp. dublinensis LMG 23823]MDI6456937.1 hypothetical protein [Cronobacter muytjensii]MDI7270803.1 hypothetical protein [Cronobacter dublinensis]MDK1256873.1 hypothetical protein [Cronobacter malonaticus]